MLGLEVTPLVPADEVTVMHCKLECGNAISTLRVGMGRPYLS